MSDQSAAVAAEAAQELAATKYTSHARTWSPGFIAKLILMAMVTAGCVYGVFMAIAAESWVIAGVSVLILAILLYVYFSKKAIPAKYLVPGMIFLFIFQIYVMGYTAFVAFTNQGGAHSADKEDAIVMLQQYNLKADPSGGSYTYSIFDDGGDYSVAIVNSDGDALVGSDGEAFTPTDNAEISNGKVTKLDGNDPVSPPNNATSWEIPLSEDDPSQGVLKIVTLNNAQVYQSSLSYDEATDTMTNTETGTVYHDNGEGSYESDSGETLSPGWWVMVGFDNFTTLFTDSTMSKGFLDSLWWTFAFAFLSVATTFFFGLILAIVFNHPHIRGQKIYRVLLILPYAFPGFMTPLIWKAMMNTDFGFINQTLFGGATIGWLDGPWIAKFSILFVNLWLGYPYMFLVTTGALQSLPGDILESAKVDGASTFQTFKAITLPLVFVACAPLLISSFAFNFNNFTLIYMLTGGGPNPVSNPNVPGQTDILISMVYKVSGLDGSGQQNYGLATALSIIIFVLVGLISIYSFRRTRSLEDMG
ncbi:MAG: ABC transporter permease subunit [Propionibacteriaceae bacterium]|jgi:arabinogalactan oligomer/maltooligosaccharide transport system permease protein|nr:ABC transporter permease subunit [Propionibacteriaceae bacterium]